MATGKDTILEGLGMAHLVASFPSRQHVNALLDFLIVAFAAFMLVRQVNRLKRVEKLPEAISKPARSITPTLLPGRLVSPSAHLLQPQAKACTLQRLPRFNAEV